MISPADMVLFAAVVRAGGFTAAARELGITKQTASERIARLEAALGVRLLERTTRRLRVTEAGADYRERCEAIARQIEEANREVQRRKAEPTGLLRVTAPTLYGRRFLAPVLAAYLGRHPAARLEVVLADRRVDLLGEGLDLAIRVGELDDSSLSHRKLGEGHTYHVASPGFVAAHGSPSPSALRGARCVAIRAGETWEVDGVEVKIEPVLVVNDLEMACEAAIAGVGIARLPGLVCRQAVLDGRLLVLPTAQPAVVRPVYAVFPSHRHLSASVRSFLDLLVALVEPMTPLDAPPARRRAARSRR